MNKSNTVARIALLTLALTAAFVFNTTLRAQAPPGSLWYNGDWDFVGFHANELNTSSSRSQVFDDFFIQDGAGWHVTSLFSRNLISTTVTGAVWEIRVGLAPGNGGTLVASGSTNTPIVTATGRSGFGFNEFTVQVSMLNIFLAPDHYWLNVTPIGDGTGRSLNTTTSGAMAVGEPPGNNGMSYFRPEGMFSPDDFSMGVIGTVVPEPTTWALLGGGLGMLLVGRRRPR